MDASRRRDVPFASILLALLLGGYLFNPAHAEEQGADLRRFSGRVVNEAGEPLAGARVYFTASYRRLDDLVKSSSIYRPSVFDGTENPHRVRAVTDANGRFDFLAEDAVFTDLDGLPTPRPISTIVAEANGYGIDWLPIRRYLPGHHRYRDDAGLDLTLRLPIDDTPLRGRLIDEQGRPLPGMRVKVRSIAIPKDRDLTTHLEKQEKPDRTLSVPKHKGRLQSPSSALPWGVQTEAESNAAGEFSLRGLGRDRIVTLRVDGPGVIAGSATVMTRRTPDVGVRIRNGKPTATIHGSTFTITLSPGRSIRGRVLDSETGRPIGGMRVVLTQKNHPLTQAATTDAQGWYVTPGASLEHRRDLVVMAQPPLGGAHLPAGSPVGEETLAFGNPVLITCERGVPFRLMLTDHAGLPIEGKVTYNAISPNPRARHSPRLPRDRPAVALGDGVYEGLAYPGPGALFVRTGGHKHRVAFVDPKSFFEPGRSDWAAREGTDAYGNQTYIRTVSDLRSQLSYAAIVLINPEPGSGPLELRATVHPNRPTQVTLRDPAGQPLTGAAVRWQQESWSYPLRTATLPLDRLHPNRKTRLLFQHRERKLVGFLSVQGESDAPLSVQLAPSGIVYGWIVDQDGAPLNNQRVTLSGDAVIDYSGALTNSRGWFRLRGLVPDETYDLSVSTHRHKSYGTIIKGMTLTPGETRDLGNLQVGPLKEK